MSKFSDKPPFLIAMPAYWILLVVFDVLIVCLVLIALPYAIVQRWYDKSKWFHRNWEWVAIAVGMIFCGAVLWSAHHADVGDLLMLKQRPN